MTGTYFKTALRNLFKNKGFTAINIIGLSIGLTGCLLIVLYVVDEMNYDRHNKDADRIYRITEFAKLNDHEGSYAGTEKPLKEALRSFPEIEKTTRLIPTNSLFLSPKKFHIRKGNDNIQETKIVYTESSLFDVFTLPVIEGKALLDEPHTAVITESASKKYFGNTNVAGQTLVVNDSGLYKVTAVIKDVPSQSHFNYDIFLSFSSVPEYAVNGWGYSGIHNYVLLKPGTDTKKLEAELEKLEYRNYPASMHTNGNYLAINLTPIRDIHLKSTSQYELSPTGTLQYVYIFSVVAAFILLIACVNFMNLSTARSSSRAKEVGVRKVLGSAKKHLVAQFLTESLLITLVSTILAVILSVMALPYFNEVANKQLILSAELFKWLIPALLGIVIVVGLLAGSYPAFFLSRFKPTEVLKGKLSMGFKSGGVRNFLVVFQFSISVFLIIATIVIYNQLNFIHKKDVGYDRNQVLQIKNVNVLGKQAASLKQEIKQLPGVVSTTMSSYVPTGEERKITGMFPQLPLDIKQDVLSQFWEVDEDYLQTMGIKLVNGRNFSPAIASDSMGLIVNEAFVKRFGFKDPLDKPIYRNSVGLQSFHIIGVMKDFNFSSLRESITPVALSFNENNGAINARVQTGNLPALLATIENKWNGFSPNQKLSYSFMDDDFDAMYRSEQRIGSIFISFSLLAIFIACLGLFGLATYAAEQRIKEIGIRKVLGASTSRIIRILSFDFIKLVIISILIASPLAWWFMHNWLQDFAYRTNIQWWVIAGAGSVALLIAFVTTSFQAVRAAFANPVESLRSE
ncbi:MAG: ABC transporter permease [Ferruginibacter sp.]